MSYSCADFVSDVAVLLQQHRIPNTEPSDAEDLDSTALLHLHDRLALALQHRQRLLTLANQYASECGECAGTRVQPDDSPCEECVFIHEAIAGAPEIEIAEADARLAVGMRDSELLDALREIERISRDPEGELLTVGELASAAIAKAEGRA